MKLLTTKDREKKKSEALEHKVKRLQDLEAEIEARESRINLLNVEYNKATEKLKTDLRDYSTSTEKAKQELREGLEELEFRRKIAVESLEKREESIAKSEKKIIEQMKEFEILQAKIDAEYSAARTENMVTEKNRMLIDVEVRKARDLRIEAERERQTAEEFASIVSRNCDFETIEIEKQKQEAIEINNGLRIEKKILEDREKALCVEDKRIRDERLKLEKDQRQLKQVYDAARAKNLL